MFKHLLIWLHHSFFWVWVYQHYTSWLSNICPLFFAKMLQSVRLRGISCAQPSSYHPTDFQSDSGLSSGWAIPKLQSSSGEAILLLIWMYALGCCCAERWSSSLFSFLAVLCQYWLVFGLFIIPSTLTKSPVPAEKNSPKAWCCHHHAHCGYGVSFGDVRCCCFLPNIHFRIMTKKFNLGFIRP